MTTPGTQVEIGEVAVETAAPVAGPVVSKSPTQLALARFRADKLSMFSFYVVVFYLIAALLAPILVATGVLDPFTPHQDLIDDQSLPLNPFGGISWEHPFGVEPRIGRDSLSRIWYGISFSLSISLLATLIAVTLGVVLGIIAGTSGGWVDAIIGRIIDLTLAFPQTLMLLALSTVAVAFITQVLHVPEGPTAQFVYVVSILGIFGWTSTARIVRGQVLSIREREFVYAARLLGAGPGRIYFKEILPNLWAPILVQFTLIMPAFISAEAALSYLGVSVKPPTPTLGNVLTDSLSFMSDNFTYFIIPAVLIALIVVCFNLLGDGLRDALDPKSGR
ncbi:ABC transporter permease [Nocardioides albus]|uniref:Peptide/nickel transport system permease protein n=1 Tax=Nocardioides albus TaxID=1841 RepID=A0A7W5A9G5_9ACTN|nr:ABC transporter permease [Nocardioides albus]MBB3091789.1 peptide/nickel transport system permease protein [Nocardioides albus]